MWWRSLLLYLEKGWKFSSVPGRTAGLILPLFCSFFVICWAERCAGEVRYLVGSHKLTHINNKILDNLCPEIGLFTVASMWQLTIKDNLCNNIRMKSHRKGLNLHRSVWMSLASVGLRGTEGGNKLLVDDRSARTRTLRSPGFPPAGCQRPVGLSRGKAKVCYYSGWYYCQSCHQDNSFLIPARLLHNWDTSKHKVHKQTQTKVKNSVNASWKSSVLKHWTKFYIR